MNDLISRQATLDLARDICIPTKDGSIYRHRCIDPDAVRELPSAQPDLDEWCTDCKEYDPEKHHCPRFNRVIQEALKDTQPEIIHCKDCVKHNIGVNDTPYKSYVCPLVKFRGKAQGHEFDYQYCVYGVRKT